MHVMNPLWILLILDIVFSVIDPLSGGRSGKLCDLLMVLIISKWSLLLFIVTCPRFLLTII